MNGSVMSAEGSLASGRGVIDTGDAVIRSVGAAVALLPPLSPMVCVTTTGTETMTERDITTVSV